LVLGSLEME